jgi:hypothetical protein
VIYFLFQTLNMTYEEYLPKVLGEFILEKLKYLTASELIRAAKRFVQE